VLICSILCYSPAPENLCFRSMVATPVRRVVLAATQVQIDWTNLKPYRLFGLFWSRVYDRLHVCIRFSVECGCLRLARGGELIQWSSRCRYLDVYFCYCWQVFFDHSKYQFFASFIAIFSKVGRFASEEVVLNFLRAKCLSVLLWCWIMSFACVR